MPQNHDDKIVADAVAQLATVFEHETPPLTDREQSDAFWSACQKVAQNAGISLSKPLVVPLSGNIVDYLTAIANASRFRFRKVTLQGNWWETDNGPLLAFDTATNTPVALIIEKIGQYKIFNPVTGQTHALTPQAASALALQAFSFYRTLPDTELNWKNILNFALALQKKDVLYLLLLQVSVGLLGLFVPIATGIILDDAVPNANMSILLQFVFGLLVCTFAAGAFSFAQALYSIRLRFKIDAATQPAVWDRLLRLPMSFFRQFTPGDLALRTEGIDEIQQTLTDATLETILSSIFSVLTLLLMLYYSVLLTLGAVVLLIILLGIIFLYSKIELRFQRPITHLQGKLADLSLQFLSSISKLRVSNSESRAFAIWAAAFRQKSRLFFQAGVWGIRFTIIRAIFSIFILLWLYGFVGTQLTGITFGHFIAFNAAFGQFFAAILALASVVTTIIRMIPYYERTKPILTQAPELEKEGIEPGILSGKIKIANVSFRYDPEAPFILEDLSFTINPGEKIALVGATGSGKSTLLRLLLGFETPTQGRIFYGEDNLAKLNIRSVRDQLGVVLQNGTLMPTTIFENVIGSYQLTIEEAWDALNQVGLAKDVEAMPMGIHTLVMEGGKTLSVGQRQRLMIARALVRKPRILLLDEATSAIDNPTQTEIMANLAQLDITQLIIAHRLSTLVHTDLIYVIDSGKIVQSGSYHSLLAEEGIFSELAKRQLL